MHCLRQWCSRANLARVYAAAGWRAAEPVTETDTYYSRPDVDYLVTVECLRVRSRGDATEITYKPPSTGRNSVDGMVAKEETNVALAGGQADVANRLLECVGMRLLARVAKRRTAYRHTGHPDAVVTIDTVAGAGTFAETEVIAAEPDAAAALVARIEQGLGLLECPTVDLPYRDLVLRAAGAVG
ncbi:hypothetical protein ADL22_07500 [Streptomyces sp. NRRL F-4489]|nr:hypothetical protein ADL22_07500 [Streptomyces sp. NRRL F-4489]